MVNKKHLLPLLVLVFKNLFPRKVLEFSKINYLLRLSSE